MFAKNAWYAAATAAVLSDTPLAGTLPGEQLLFFRGADGGGAALADRRCRPFTPLSPVDIEPGGIRCRCRGLKFDRSGRCVEIPGQDDIPPGTGVRACPPVERHGLLRIRLGRSTRAGVGEIVGIRRTGAPGWPTATGAIRHPADERRMANTLPDVSRRAFVNRTTQANSALISARPEDITFERGTQTLAIRSDATLEKVRFMIGQPIAPERKAGPQ